MRVHPFNVQTATSSTKAQMKVMLLTDVKKAALKKHETEVGLEAQFTKVNCTVTYRACSCCLSILMFLTPLVEVTP